MPTRAHWSFFNISKTSQYLKGKQKRVGGALRLRPLTPPYVRFRIRRFNNLSIDAHING